MPGSTQAGFYLSATALSPGYGTDVRDLTATGTLANDDTSIVNFGTSGSKTLVVDPLSSNTSLTDQTIYGWLMQQSTMLQGAAGARRFVPAGVWTFNGHATAQQATGASTTFTMYVYRVDASTLARTLLFSANAVFTTALLGTDFAITSSSQPQIILEAGEQLHVGFTAASTGAALGNATAFRIGSNYGLVLPSPGLRTLYDGSGRSPSDTASASDTPTRIATHPRSLSDTAAASDTVTRQLTLARSLSETASASDNVARVATFPRATSDTASASDTVTRIATHPRAISDTASATDSVARQLTLARSISDTAPSSDSVTRQLTYVRAVKDSIGSDPNDFTGPVITLSITGITRDQAGAVLGGATVKLVRQSDDRVVQTTTSDGSGNYTFPRAVGDPNTYYVIAYKAGTPEVHGISDRGLTPA